MENKRKNVYITIFVITTIVAACAAVYFAIKLSTDTKNFEERLNELSSKVEETTENNVNEEESKEANTQEEVKDDNEKIKEKIVEKYGLFKSDVSNCLNKKSDDVIYSDIINVSYDSYGFICNLQNDKKTIGMSVSLNKFNDTFPNVVNSKEYLNQIYYTFDEEVVALYIGGIGNGAATESEILFCIMKDGTVYCMNIYNAIKDNNYKSFVKLDEINNIVSIKNVGVNFKNSPVGYSTIVAFNQDGMFYDLEEILKKKGLINNL